MLCDKFFYLVHVRVCGFNEIHILNFYKFTCHWRIQWDVVVQPLFFSFFFGSDTLDVPAKDTQEDYINPHMYLDFL